MRRPPGARALAGAMLTLTLALGACSGGDQQFGVEEAGDAPADFFYEIPAGAGEAVDRGEPLDILPATLDVTTGQVIEIVNDDSRGHLIGPFFVGANETVRHEFSSPGRFEGVCSVHSSGQIVITVT